MPKFPPGERHAHVETYKPDLVSGLFLANAPAKLNVVVGTYEEKVIHVPAGTEAQRAGGHTMPKEMFTCVDSETQHQVIGLTEHIVAMWQATSDT